MKFVVVKNLRPVHTNWGDATFKAENRVEEGMERLDVDQLWRDRKLYSDVTIICQGEENATVLSYFSRAKSCFLTRDFLVIPGVIMLICILPLISLTC